VVVVDFVVGFVVVGVVVVVVGAGPGGQGHEEKSGLVGPLAQPPQCSVCPQSLNR